MKNLITKFNKTLLQAAKAQDITLCHEEYMLLLEPSVPSFIKTYANKAYEMVSSYVNGKMSKEILKAAMPVLYDYVYSIVDQMY